MTSVVDFAFDQIVVDLVFRKDFTVDLKRRRRRRRMEDGGGKEWLD